MRTWRLGILLAMALLLAGSSGCDEITSKPLPRITAPPTNKRWQDPVLVGASEHVLNYPRVAVSGFLDSKNHWRRFAVVTWAEVPSNLNMILATIHARNFTWEASTGFRIEPPLPSGWGADTPIGESDAYDVNPDVGMYAKDDIRPDPANPGGLIDDTHVNALAVWQNKQNIYYNRYFQETGAWADNMGQTRGRSMKFDNDLTPSMHPPRIAMNQTAAENHPATAIVTWHERVKFPTGIFDFVPVSAIFAKMSSGPSWNFPSGEGIQLNPQIQPSIVPPEYHDRRPPQVALDPRANALAVWEDTSIFYNYQAANGRGSPIMSGSPPPSADEDPRVALDGPGNGLAVWINGGRVFAGRFTPGIGGQWAGLQEISAPQTGASEPRVAMQQKYLEHSEQGPPGEGMAVWVQGGRIYAKRFDPAAGGWEDQPHALSNTDGAVSSPAIAMNDSGNAVAVWLQQVGGEYGVFAAYFTRGYGWGGPVPLKIASGRADFVDVAIYPDGNALVVWKQLYGQSEHAIFARFYAPPLR
jgi:hypothetical protein